MKHNKGNGCINLAAAVVTDWHLAGILCDAISWIQKYAANSDLRSGALCFTKSHKWKKRQRKEMTTGILLYETMYLQQGKNSRRLIDVSNYRKNNYSSVLPDNVPSALCYFLAAIATQKVS